jgi:hypothetical protein
MRTEAAGFDRKVSVALHFLTMAGLEPAIQLSIKRPKLDGRVKPAHGELRVETFSD